MKDKRLEFEVKEFECHCKFPSCNKKEQFLRIVEPVKSMVRYAMEKFDTFKDYLRTAYKTEDVVIRISSGCRCEAWNKEKKGVPNSYHLYKDSRFVAADMQIIVNKKQISDDEAMHHLKLFFGDKITYMNPTSGTKGAVHVTLKVVK